MTTPTRAPEVARDLRVLALRTREGSARGADVEFGIADVELRERLVAMHAGADIDVASRLRHGCRQVVVQQG